MNVNDTTLILFEYVFEMYITCKYLDCYDTTLS